MEVEFANFDQFEDKKKNDASHSGFDDMVWQIQASTLGHHVDMDAFVEGGAVRRAGKPVVEKWTLTTAQERQESEEYLRALEARLDILGISHKKHRKPTHTQLSDMMLQAVDDVDAPSVRDEAVDFDGVDDRLEASLLRAGEHITRYDQPAPASRSAGERMDTIGGNDAGDNDGEARGSVATAAKDSDSDCKSSDLSETDTDLESEGELFAYAALVDEEDEAPEIDTVHWPAT